MGDGYFYTLSAVAQSFAAIIAVNGMFVIYKLGILKSRRSELISKLRFLRQKEMGGDSGFVKNCKHGRELVDRFSNEDLIHWVLDNSGRSDIVAEKKRIGKEINNCNQLSGRIIHWFRLPLIINACTIIFSLFLLPWKNVIPCFLEYIFIICVLILSLLALSVSVHSVLVTIELRGFSFIERIFRRYE